MPTYADETAEVANEPYYFFRIEGIPSFTSPGVADTHAAPLSLSTLRPAFLPTC